MSLVKERHKKIIEKFQELLRSGKDYTVNSMCHEAGKVVYIEGESVKKIINRHYQQIINQEMVDFLNNLECNRQEEIKQFSEKFDVCRRESILLIRYLRRGEIKRAKKLTTIHLV
jgi:hypothetical protein